ncbi:DUF3263 domain-containing protein [Micromonospora sp. HM5-17]|jgi:hypothetical protein|uniref:DUF3263 domain-containing protein n=1 Tax=Micromonospora sp. HM5-17 TaxID=2487710 RepID=UPI000F4A66CA|nr:DUF3263 domain-containing protein [Micromonospora sp. HM5-17]ROT26264.1 DUF3263 domain-containing protein [Micromonospora sp. HM5-17]
MRYADAPAGDEAGDAAGRERPIRVPQPRTEPEPAAPADPGDPADLPEASASEPGRSAAGPGPTLTDREREILAFERRWWRHAGAKEQAIRDAFDISATRYYQILNGLLDNPAALAAEPVLVARLRRLRAARSRGRGR